MHTYVEFKDLNTNISGVTDINIAKRKYYYQAKNTEDSGAHKRTRVVRRNMPNHRTSICHE